MTPTPGEISQIRYVAESMLPNFATIKRAVEVGDGSGGQTQTWATVASSVPCRIKSQTTEGIKEIAERISDSAVYVVTFSYSTDVQTQDRVEIGSDSYAVKFVEHHSCQTNQRALCTKL